MDNIMSYIYAVEEASKRRFLYKISCDYIGCSNIYDPKVREEGWIKRGSDYGTGTDKFECYYCPNHSY